MRGLFIFPESEVVVEDIVNFTTSWKQDDEEEYDFVTVVEVGDAGSVVGAEKKEKGVPVPKKKPPTSALYGGIAKGALKVEKFLLSSDDAEVLGSFRKEKNVGIKTPPFDGYEEVLRSISIKTKSCVVEGGSIEKALEDLVQQEQGFLKEAMVLRIDKEPQVVMSKDGKKFNVREVVSLYKKEKSGE